MELLRVNAEILFHASNHDDIPMFHNLSFLGLIGILCEWHLIQLLLHRTPNLQMLVFRLVSYDGERSAIDGCLKKPRDVPKCLSSQLTTCYFEGFSRRKVEMKLKALIQIWLFEQEDLSIKG
ncbi:uncharacterized protein LOC126728849 [Quercus robur]|uniref:uncharacterized protein LOC126728849 n=1 Tax=Quercus robur TaxID=38942 RepID=UPI0021616BCE|nr:uncharacterized protein LOC126728849 [Quercus robur]